MEQQVGTTNRYRIISKLCSGGMADIFLGVQLDQRVLERLVVIKKVHDVDDADTDALGMFADEARIISTLSHPHIVQIYDFTQEADSFHLVMEYIDGENLGYILSELRKQTEAIPLPIVFRLMEQALEALHYIHNATNRSGESLNIVHRDLDPRNLMMDANGYLKIIDFGVAKAIVQTELTAPGLFKGKLSHVAPEIFTQSDIDHRADIYSIGLVLFELATGQKPYSFGKSPVLVDTINRIVDEPIPLPSDINPDIPPELEQVILIACEKNREERYQSAEELHEALIDVANKILGVGIASNAEVKHWFTKHFNERLTKRRSFENQTLQKAKRHFESVPPNRRAASPSSLAEGETMGLASISGEDSLQRCRITGMDTGSGISFAAANSDRSSSRSTQNPYVRSSQASGPIKPFNMDDGSDNMGTPPRRRFAKLVALSATAALAVFAVVLFFAMDGFSENNNENGDNNAAKEEKKESSVTVASSMKEAKSPKNEGVKENEVAVGAPTTVPMKAPESAAESNPPTKTAQPKAVASLSANRYKKSKKWSRSSRSKRKRNESDEENEEETPTRPLSGDPYGRNEASDNVPSSTDNARTKEDRIVPDQKELNTPLSKPTPVVAVKPAPLPQPIATVKPTPSSVPVPAPPAKTTAPKWISKTGNWNGPTVIRKGCSSCHTSLKATSKTASQWEYFFSHNRHRRHGDLKKLFSKEELRRVQSHLISVSKKKEEKSSGIAGIR